MKVGIISERKNYDRLEFIEVLGGIYSRSQAKDVAVISTGKLNHLTSAVQVDNYDKEISSIHVFKTLVEAATLSDNDLFDYAARAGMENVFIYDVYNTSLAKEDKLELIHNCIKKLPADLVLVDIQGDLNDPDIKLVLKECDVYLYLFTQNSQSFQSAREFVSDYDQDIVQRTGFVCLNYNPAICAEKFMASELKMPISNIMCYPFCVPLKKLAIDGMLNRAIPDIISCKEGVAPMRMRLYEIMCYLFDTRKRKIIREIKRWYN